MYLGTLFDIIKIGIMASKKFNTEYYAFLAKRIRDHDQKAFTELYYATYDDLYRYTFYFIKDAHMAQDALQEVYISIYKNISSLKSDRLFYSWIKQITHHVCCDFLRKSGSITNHEALGIEKKMQVPDDKDAFQNIWDQDISDQLRIWLDELPSHSRQAFILRYQDNLKLEEIADFMGCSLSSVKRYLNSAKDFLKKKLAVYQ